ncbi:glycosyltransferase family 4 protein [Roseivivax marinus]|uniref:glycosyltransferase family 4 protein n=1 Tax=Roseivivax marinus TaxID=1379903 RepID=UPI001F040603|nr:glycosyltransferase family 4 protein [Roseivivax marinus]UMA64582.1 glycosyltransferase family 4 protein [Roseivivax marinus]
MASTSRPRVLVIAEAANPEWVSVPLVGWSLARALSEVAHVHLVTQVRNRDAILHAGLREGTDFTAIDSEALAAPAWRVAQALRMGEGKGWTMIQALNALSYPWFERLVWRRFGSEITRGDWDIVHRVTPLSPTVPSPLAAKVARTGTPFLLGPLNGGVPWPRAFDAERRREREWLSYLRGAYRALPGRDATLRHATAILAGSRHTATEIPARHAHKVVWLPENGIDPERFGTAQTPPCDGPLVACFVGRLVPYKGPDMLLEAALPLLHAGRLRLEIVGDGPMMDTLRAAAPVGDAVTFHGWRPHADVQRVLGRAHLFAFPSIREFGGGAVLEAMALGVPPLVVDYAGPGELVDDRTGYTVPLTDRAGIVAVMRARLTALADDRSGLAARGAAGRDRVSRHFTWHTKARQIATLYDWALNAAEDTPPPTLLSL